MFLQYGVMRSFIYMKQYSLFAVLSISMIVIAMPFVRKGNEQPDKHLEIVLRNIGHQLLLHSNDSTSRVLPIETVNDHTFRISFQNSFGFTPDTLMTLVHKQLAKTDNPENYTVSVNDCYHQQTIFAYEVNSKSGNLTPCRGREQKKSCYVIEISFPAKNSFNYAWLLLTIIPLAFAGLYFMRKRKRIAASNEMLEENIAEELPKETDAVEVVDEYKQLGEFEFFESKSLLRHNGETIELSTKETKALSILLSNLNQVVGRDVLMKELWEDDGVVVITRNVDVLISKLRKRLSADPSIKIVNVHGKGYKLMA